MSDGWLNSVRRRTLESIVSHRDVIFESTDSHIKQMLGAESIITSLTKQKKRKAVLITETVDDFQSWIESFQRRGAQLKSPPKDPTVWMSIEDQCDDPQLVISTPSGLLSALRNGDVSLSTCYLTILDSLEALTRTASQLTLVQAIVRYLPKARQTVGFISPLELDAKTRKNYMLFFRDPLAMRDHELTLGKDLAPSMSIGKLVRIPRKRATSPHSNDSISDPLRKTGVSQAR